MSFLCRETRYCEIHMKMKRSKCIKTCLWLLVIPCVLCAQNQYRTKPETRVTAEPQELIRITPSADHIRLEPNLQSDNRLGPWASSGAFSVNFRSAIPAIGVAVEAVRLRGPEGDLPPDRIWISTDKQIILLPAQVFFQF